MSDWAYISATLKVSTRKSFKEEGDDGIAWVHEKLNKAPKVSGSEGAVNMFVNKLPADSTCSCVGMYGKEHCPFGEKSWRTCTREKDKQCRGSRTHDFVITLFGPVRDAETADVKEQYSAFVTYIRTKLKWGFDCIWGIDTLKIKDSYGNEIIE